MFGEEDERGESMGRGHSLEERVDVAAQVARIDPVVQLVLVLDDDAHLVLRTFQLLKFLKIKFHISR